MVIGSKANGSGPTSSSNAFHLEPTPRRRKVPDNLRQRIETSCDRCKTRKRRCIRPSEDDSCQACEEAGIDCRSTLPRKRRNQVSQSSARYALLDSIVRKLYPETEVETLTGLNGLADKLGIEPGLNPLSGIKEEMTNQSEGGDQETTSPPQEQEQVGKDTMMKIDPFNVPEGWLVPAPKGGSHYIGQSSLVHFANCVRKLVGKSNILNQPSYDEKGLRRYLQAAEYTTYKISHAIEAGLQNHPATIAASADDTSSPYNSSSRGQLPDPSSTSGTGNNIMSSSKDDAPRHPRMFDRKLSDRLVEAFFERVHPNMPVLHRGSFQMQYARDFNVICMAKEPGWTCKLFMVYVLGAQVLEGDIPNSRDIQQHYLAIIIREGLGRLVLTSTLSNVQALLLLALYQHNAGERNTSWILTGQAIRSGIALGLHRSGDNNQLDPFEKNTRRMVWWVSILFEQFVSLALGRPSFTDMFSADAKLPDTSFQMGTGLPLNCFESQVNLSKLIVKIKQTSAYTTAAFEDSATFLEWRPAVMAVHSDLKAWKHDNSRNLSLNQHFTSRIHHRLIVILSMWGDFLEGMLCKSYLLNRVSCDIEGKQCPSEIEQIATLSIEAAKASATKFLILADQGLIESSVWLDLYAANQAITITALHFLGRPNSTGYQDLKESISKLISVMQGLKLAPTYRIHMNVVMQLAYITGIGPEIPPLPINFEAPLCAHVPKGAEELSKENILEGPTFRQNEGVSAEEIPSTSSTGTYQTPIQTTSLHPPVHASHPGTVSAIPNNLPTASTSTGQKQSHPEQVTLQLMENLFGPMPSSRNNSQPDVYADLYNFGYNADPSNPWDLFNLGDFAHNILADSNQIQNPQAQHVIGTQQPLPSHQSQHHYPLPPYYDTPQRMQQAQTSPVSSRSNGSRSMQIHDLVNRGPVERGGTTPTHGMGNTQLYDPSSFTLNTNFQNGRGFGIYDCRD